MKTRMVSKAQVEKGESDMKVRMIGWGRAGAVLAASFAAVLLLAAGPAAAAVNCASLVAGATADTDKDGYLDTEECAGITLPQGFTSPAGASGVVYPNCVAANAARESCLDPDTPDLFVILGPAAQGSKIPANAWQFVSKSTSQGGLGVAVHEIRAVAGNTSRIIVRNQNAVSVAESLDTTSGTELGVAQQTTPNGPAYATVFTQRIENLVSAQCPSGTTCKDSGGATGNAAVRDLYIQHSLAHECSHLLSLTTVYNSRFGGYHYKSGSGYILDQSVVFTAAKGVTTFYITKLYTAADNTGALLK
jgi:hypothetical protein